MKKSLLIFCWFILMPAWSMAEEAAPHHACVKPVPSRPPSPVDPTVAKGALPKDRDFYSQVDRYKDCIWRFVVAERKAAQLHTTAAEGAIEEWYAFIRESIASGALQER